MFGEKKDPNEKINERVVFRMKKEVPVNYQTVKFHFEDTTTTIEFSSRSLMEKLISALQEALDNDTEPENDTSFILVFYSENYQPISSSWPGVDIISKLPIYAVRKDYTVRKEENNGSN